MREGFGFFSSVFDKSIERYMDFLGAHTSSAVPSFEEACLDNAKTAIANEIVVYTARTGTKQEPCG